VGPYYKVNVATTVLASEPADNPYPPYPYPCDDPYPGVLYPWENPCLVDTRVRICTDMDTDQES
jgi:hypothetical protein